MLLSAALEEYLFALDPRPAYARWLRQKLEAFVAWCATQEVTQVDGLTPKLVNTYIRSMRDALNERYNRPLSDRTVHGYARALRAFVNWCVKDELLPVGFFERVAMPKQSEKVIDVFTPKEIRALFNACKDEQPDWLNIRNKAILTVLLDTGIRAGELCGVRLQDVFLAQGDSYLVVTGKRNKERQVPVGKDCRMTLHRWIHRERPNVSSNALFPNRRNIALTPQGLDKMLYRLRDRTLLPFHADVRAHVFRHTFAFMYMDNGGDLLRLSRILGHASVSITQEYLKAFTSQHARKGSLSVFDALSGK